MSLVDPGLSVREVLKVEIAKAKRAYDRLPSHFEDDRDLQMAEVFRLIDMLRELERQSA